jgi:hypothetical protein
MVASGIGDKGERKPIMKKTVLVSATILMFTAGIAKAVHVWEDPGAWGSGIFVYNVPPENRFPANELSLDLSGSYIAPERGLQHLFETDIRHRGKWGGNVGVNYFFLPYLGIGGNINMSDNRGAFVDQALGNLILRFPICPISVAPYIFGGGGRGFDPSWEWFADGGVGLEWRPNATTGIFTDATYMWHLKDGSVDRLLLRAGIRLAF